MAVIAVARPLREKLGEEATDALIALINEADESNKKPLSSSSRNVLNAAWQKR